ncbi:hypothetical protein ScPMuIL_000360 [Solemya velum]
MATISWLENRTDKHWALLLQEKNPRQKPAPKCVSVTDEEVNYVLITKLARGAGRIPVQITDMLPRKPLPDPPKHRGGPSPLRKVPLPPGSKTYPKSPTEEGSTYDDVRPSKPGIPDPPGTDTTTRTQEQHRSGPPPPRNVPLPPGSRTYPKSSTEEKSKPGVPDPPVTDTTTRSQDQKSGPNAVSSNANDEDYLKPNQVLQLFDRNAEPSISFLPQELGNEVGYTVMGTPTSPRCVPEPPGMEDILGSQKKPNTNKTQTSSKGFPDVKRGELMKTMQKLKPVDTPYKVDTPTLKEYQIGSKDDESDMGEEQKNGHYEEMLTVTNAVHRNNPSTTGSDRGHSIPSKTNCKKTVDDVYDLQCQLMEKEIIKVDLQIELLKQLSADVATTTTAKLFASLN